MPRHLASERYPLPTLAAKFGRMGSRVQGGHFDPCLQRRPALTGLASRSCLANRSTGRFVVSYCRQRPSRTLGAVVSAAQLLAGGCREPTRLMRGVRPRPMKQQVVHRVAKAWPRQWSAILHVSRGQTFCLRTHIRRHYDLSGGSVVAWPPKRTTNPRIPRAQVTCLGAGYQSRIGIARLGNPAGRHERSRC